ncbi:3'-flap repair endonuclease Xpf [uncultured archaeon]|nr:3'-flap repair endonuclease Xpf [uncultured archaeon]
MKPMFDIFSRPKQREVKEKPKQKIFVDYREKNSMVASELIHLGFEVEFLELKVGDYLVNNIAIERKTVSDFISSMINRHLAKQLDELQQYENKLLLIEGLEEHELYSDNSEGMNANAVRGFLLSILLKHKIPIIFTKNAEDTAKFIDVLARKKENESSLNATKKSFNKQEQMQFIIEGFPGIGPKTAKKLLEKFKTMKNIFSASQEELEKEIGKKANIFKLVGEEYI